MYPGVVKVTNHPDFTLDIEFDNGEEKTLEMAPYLEQKAFGKIKDYERFKRVKASARGGDIHPDNRLHYPAPPW